MKLSATRAPQLVGILGNPLAHSLSPAMQNAWFRALDLPFVYCAFPVEPRDFCLALEGLQVLGARGVNITIPYKQDAWRLADFLGPEAARAGAVNTLLFQEDALWGYNTDVLAVKEGLSRLHLPEKEGRCLLLGSGGAAAGALAALEPSIWSEVTLCCRTPEKGEALLQRSGGELAAKVLPWEALQEDLGPLDLWINATSLGLPSSPWPEGMLRKILEKNSPRNLMDFVYSPEGETSCIRWARQGSIPGIAGEELLLFQGVEAFRLFTGREVPHDMRYIPGHTFPKEANS